jgi:hypothetical protein
MPRRQPFEQENALENGHVLVNGLAGQLKGRRQIRDVDEPSRLGCGQREQPWQRSSERMRAKSRTSRWICRLNANS